MKILKKITLAVCFIVALTAVVGCKKNSSQMLASQQSDFEWEEEFSQSESQEEQFSQESESSQSSSSEEQTSQEYSSESDMPTSSDDSHEVDDSSVEEEDSSYTGLGGCLVPSESDIDFIN